MNCRSGCGACCIAPAISSPIPGMPDGKPAGVACIQLDAELRCRLFGQPTRPEVCRRLRPEPAMCGNDRDHALVWLTRLEQATAPAHRLALDQAHLSAELDPSPAHLL